jgi:hypothetical protein
MEQPPSSVKPAEPAAAPASGTPVPAETKISAPTNEAVEAVELPCSNGASDAENDPISDPDVSFVNAQIEQLSIEKAALTDRVQAWRESLPKERQESLRGLGSVYLHAKMCAQQPFIAKTWLFDRFADNNSRLAQGLNVTEIISLLHDPEPAQIQLAAEFWKSVVGCLHTASAVSPFGAFPLLNGLYTQCDDGARQSLVRKLFPSFPDFSKVVMWCNSTGKQSELLARVQFHRSLYDLHASLIEVESAFFKEPSLINRYSCTYGKAVVANTPFEHFQKFEGLEEELDAQIRANLVALDVVDPRPATSFNAGVRSVIYHRTVVHEMPAYAKRKISVTIVRPFPSEGEDIGLLAHDYVEYFTRLPGGVLSAISHAQEIWADKTRAITWAVGLAVVLFLVAFVVKVVHTYRKARPRNFWKKLMTNEAHGKQLKQANGLITLIYIFGAFAAVFTMFFDGFKNVATVAGIFTTVAGLFSKSARGALNWFDLEDDEEPKSNKAHAYLRVSDDEWDGSMLPDMLTKLITSHSSHAMGEPPEKDLPNVVRYSDTDKWYHLVYKVPAHYVLRVWFWILLFPGWFLGLTLFFKVVFLCAVLLVVLPAALLFSYWIYRVLRGWYRNYRSNNISHVQLKRDLESHRVLADGEALMRSYHASQCPDVDWMHRFATYVSKKVQLALPLSDEEVQFTKVFNVDALLRNSAEVRSRSRAGQNHRTKRRIDYEQAQDDFAVDRRDILNQELDDLYDTWEHDGTPESREQLRFEADQLIREHRARNHKAHPRAEPPGAPEHRPRNRSNGINKDVKVEGSLVPIGVMKRLNQLRASLLAQGITHIPFPNFQSLGTNPKAYPASLKVLENWVHKRGFVIDIGDCPFCLEGSRGIIAPCSIHHPSIRVLPKSPPQSNRSETATREHPRALETARVAASVGVIITAEGNATCFMTKSGILTNNHAVFCGGEATVRFMGLPPVKVSLSQFRQCKDTRGKLVDVAVLEAIPATLGVPRLTIRPINELPHLGSVQMIPAKFAANGEVIAPGYEVKHGHVLGRNVQCGDSYTVNGKASPCGDGIGSYHAESGDSGAPIFDNMTNLFAIHCSGHATSNPHNHFQTLAGLDLKQLAQPLNC